MGWENRQILVVHGLIATKPSARQNHHIVIVAHSCRSLEPVDQLVAVPTNRLQILNSMSASMGPVFAVMDLEPPSPAAARTSPAVLLECFERMNRVDLAHQDL
jgi:hypothetical protein